jgi:hypothetical protein
MAMLNKTNGYWPPYKILLSPPLLHETSSMRDGLKIIVLPNWNSDSRIKKTYYFAQCCGKYTSI